MGCQRIGVGAAVAVVLGAVLQVACSPATAAAQVFVVGEKTAEADVFTEFHPTHVELPTAPLSEGGYMDLIRNLEAEQGFAHRELPLGTGFVLVANGNLTPRGEEYKQALYKKGQAAAAGERVAITALRVQRDRIIVDLNGGPFARHRFLSHISINDVQLAPQAPPPTGARVTLIFEGGVPEVTAAEVKALLDPVVDFRARSAAEAYANSMPPAVRDAIEAHKILVGMDQRMVLASVGAPKSKDREHADPNDMNSPVYEEWMYGDTPQPIQFVRFREGRVTRLEIAAIGKPVEVHDKYELGVDPGPVLLARTIVNGDDQRGPGIELGSRRPPTLAKPGETLDASATTMGRVQIPGSSDKDCKDASASGGSGDSKTKDGAAQEPCTVHSTSGRTTTVRNAPVPVVGGAEDGPGIGGSPIPGAPRPGGLPGSSGPIGTGGGGIPDPSDTGMGSPGGLPSVPNQPGFPPQP